VPRRQRHLRRVVVRASDEILQLQGGGRAGRRLRRRQERSRAVRGGGRRSNGPRVPRVLRRLRVGKSHDTRLVPPGGLRRLLRRLRAEVRRLHPAWKSIIQDTHITTTVDLMTFGIACYSRL
jgi:hypothetical protein